jgi:carbonic anhydrase
MRRLAIAAAVAASLAIFPTLAEEHAHHWSYAGETGPAHWAALEKDAEACGLGKAQSPIDIHAAKARVSDLPAIAFSYQPVPLKIIDNGHTVQVDYAPGSFITVGDARYELVQFHFHKPSEEKFDGKAADMVAHLVHKDANGKLAVVAVPLRKGAGNKLVSTLWRELPTQKEHPKVVESTTINAADLLPAKHGYFTFEGSLTTPPCSEGVRWFVLKTPATLSAAEIAAFGKLYPMNARPVQPLNGREEQSSREPAVMRQTVSPASTATINAPPRSTATPTGRPRALPSCWRNPVTKSTGAPAGWPSLNGM